MSNQKKHINTFDELIRVLNLKKHTTKEIVDNLIPSFDIKYTPDNEKSQKVINELITYQTKINKRKTIHKIYLLLISGVLLLSLMLCVLNSKKNEGQNQNVSVNQGQNSDQKKDSALSEPGTIEDANNQQDKEGTSFSYGIKQVEIDTIITDTENKIDYQLDTITTEAIIKDKIHESEINSGNYCLFPKKYKIQFDEKSVLVDEKCNNDILELADNILNCQNLKNVEIIGYYTQSFLFFNSKKLVQERIENIKKEIKKHNVSSRTIRKSKINLIRTTKSNKPGSSQLVEIILKD